MKDQSTKLEVLQKIINMMDGIDAKKMKKPDPAEAIEIEEAEGEGPEASKSHAMPDGSQMSDDMMACDEEDELMEQLRQKYAGLK